MSVATGAQPAVGRCQVIMAPARPQITGQKTIFVAGNMSKASPEPNWREDLAKALHHLPVTIFNPHRSDWDSTWKEDISDPHFKGQVEWELDMQERADLAVIYFQEGTPAPISLLEFGLRARLGKAVIVACRPGYEKKGNVQVVCERYELELVSCGKEINDAVVKWVTERTSEAGKSVSMPPSVD